MESEISILIIEDEALIAQNIKMQLESFGYNIAAVCYKYNTALAALNETQFDIIITDINLGNGIDEKSGIQLAEQVKQIKNCPIIFLTAFSDKDTIKKATTVSPSAYLVKPVNAANLFATVQLAVNNFTSKIAVANEEVESPDFYFVKQGTKLIKIFWKEVYYMASIKNYVKIKTTQYSSSVLIRGSLNQVLQNMLPATFKNNFVKINRSEAISKQIILKVGRDVIETTYGQFTVSADFKIEDL